MEKYEGFSYKNVYGTDDYINYANTNKYAEDDKYFIDSDEYTLDNGYTFETVDYRDDDTESQPYTITKAHLQKCALKKQDQVIHQFYSIYDHANPFMKFVEHSNGYTYYPFHVDLYGISFIELDTLNVYNYIPQGYYNDFGAPNGESFIILDMHYDKASDLIAYDGCYWAAPNDIMVGDFSNPLSFNPHLVSIYQLLKDTCDEFDDVDFCSWDDNALNVKLDGKTHKSISINELRTLIAKTGGSN